MTNKCEKERQQAQKHARSKSAALESVAKRAKAKEGTDLEEEIGNGPFAGFEDEYTQDEPDFDELEEPNGKTLENRANSLEFAFPVFPDEQELLLDPDADKEESPEPAALDSVSEPRGDSTEPEILPELDITYLMPKAGGTATTPCVLSTRSSFMKFQGKLMNCFGVGDFDNINVTYKLNTQPVKDSPMCLDTLEEYQHMLSEVCKALTGKGKGKKSPLPIKIFCKKHEPTPEPVPAKTASIFKASKTPKKHTMAGDKDSVDVDDDDSSTTPNWKILKTLHKDFTCNVNGHSLCFNLPSGVHHNLKPTDLSLWALTIANGRATYSNPPEKLKLTWIEKANKARDQDATVPVAVDTPAPALPVPLPAPAPPIAPYAEIATLVTTLIAALRPPVPALAEPAPAPVPAPAPTATKDNSNDHNIKFPTISDYIDVLEVNGFTHVNHLVMPDLTLKEFMEVTKINYVDSKLLIRKANEVVLELRSMM